MSKILEALDNAQADALAGGVQNEAAPSGPAARPDGASGALRFSRVSMEEEMIALRQRLDALLPDRPTRAIEFIGSREGEGTSTVVEEFARHSATRFDQRVLLLKMGLHGPQGKAIVPPLLSRKGVSFALNPGSRPVSGRQQPCRMTSNRR